MGNRFPSRVGHTIPKKSFRVRNLRHISNGRGVPFRCPYSSKHLPDTSLSLGEETRVRGRSVGMRETLDEMEGLVGSRWHHFKEIRVGLTPQLIVASADP